jgi:SAM-dependent methyltransferase
MVRSKALYSERLDPFMNSSYDPIARFYDLSHQALVDDIPFLLQQAAETGGPALELGCGSGRLLAPLARAGITVTGVDNSPEMLARAAMWLAGEAAEVRDRVRLVEGDVRSPFLPPGEPFALAYFGYNTFMHLDETAAAAALRQLRPLLRPGARLLIDVDHPLALSAAGNEPDFELEEELRDEAMGETIRQYAAYESVPGEQAVDVTWVYETGQENAEARTQVTMRYHYLYPHQYDLLLSLTGFRLLGFLGDYDGSPFDEESERLIVVGEVES